MKASRSRGESEIYRSFEGLYLLREECFIDKVILEARKKLIKTGGAMDGVRAL